MAATAVTNQWPCQASSLPTVCGRKLDDVIGEFLVLEYASNPLVQQRINSFIEPIQDFVGTTEAMTAPPSEPPTESIPQTAIAVTSDLQPALEAIRLGQLWNGLALLRRILEQRLHQFAQQRQVHCLHEWVPDALYSSWQTAKYCIPMSPVVSVSLLSVWYKSVRFAHFSSLSSGRGRRPGNASDQSIGVRGTCRESTTLLRSKDAAYIAQRLERGRCLATG